MESEISLVDTEIRFGEAQLLSPQDKSLDINGEKKKVSVIAGVKQKELSDLVNIFILSKARKLKDTLPISKALLKWCRWLEKEKDNVNPFVPSPLHYKSPTYGFREYLLISVSDHASNLSHNTASSYINVVKSFYEFLDDIDVIDKTQFFKPISRTNGRGFKVNSSDLRIRQVKQHSAIPLNPMTQSECAAFLDVINEFSTREYLMLMLMLGSGLRGQEVCTMNSTLFTSERFADNDSFLMQGIEISPAVGVATKFDIPRDLFMTKALYEEVLDYVESEEYLERLKRYRLKHPDRASEYAPLFIINGHERANENTIRNLWIKVKRIYKSKTNKDLAHKPHDLRATFGANLLSVLADELGSAKKALDIVKVALGHASLEQTIKYLNHFNRGEQMTQAANILDKAADLFYSRAYTGVALEK